MAAVINQAPVANAGTDQTIFLPATSANLDGSASTDVDNNITSYTWNKISGPSAFNIVNTSAIQTQLTELIVGDYAFELTVTDSGGLSAKDTIGVNVVASGNPPQEKDNLIFYFPDPTASLDAANMVTISFAPPLTLIIVKIANYPAGQILGMWCNSCAPKCPLSSDYYADDYMYTSFSISPGTYNWSAETVIQSFNGYPFKDTLPFPSSLVNFFSTIHKTAGTITILPNDNCVIKKIVF